MKWMIIAAMMVGRAKKEIAATFFALKPYQTRHFYENLAALGCPLQCFPRWQCPLRPSSLF